MPLRMSCLFCLRPLATRGGGQYFQFPWQDPGAGQASVVNWVLHHALSRQQAVSSLGRHGSCRQHTLCPLAQICLLRARPQCQTPSPCCRHVMQVAFSCMLPGHGARLSPRNITAGDSPCILDHLAQGCPSRAA